MQLELLQQTDESEGGSEWSSFSDSELPRCQRCQRRYNEAAFPRCGCETEPPSQSVLDYLQEAKAGRRKGQQKARKARQKAGKEELQVVRELAGKSGKVSVLTSGSPSEVAPIKLSGIGGLASSV